MFIGGLGPLGAAVVRARQFGRDHPLDCERVCVPGVHEVARRAPVRGDDRQAAGHGLEDRHAPPLASAGQHETVGGPIERSELMRRHELVQREQHPPAAGSEAEIRDGPLHTHAFVDVDDLAEQHDVFHGAELVVERPEQQLGCLSRPPLERREEGEHSCERMTGDSRIEVVRIHSERDHRDRGLDAAATEGLRR